MRELLVFCAGFSKTRTVGCTELNYLDICSVRYSMLNNLRADELLSCPMIASIARVTDFFSVVFGARAR